MPYRRRRTYKRRRKRTFSRKKKGWRKPTGFTSSRNRTLVRVRCPKPQFIRFPQTAKFNFKYAQVNELTNAAPDHSYRLISIYDPDFTGTGQQPRYMDTLLGANASAAPYHRYRVYQTHVTITFVNTSATEPANIWGCMYPLNYSTQPGTWAEAKERPFDTQCITLSPLGSGRSQKTMKFLFSPAMLYKGESMTDLVFTAAYSANPTRVPLINFKVQARGIPPLGTAPTVTYDIKIIYKTIMYQPNDVSDS